MSFTKINHFGVEELPEDFVCTSTDDKPTEGIITGSTLWEYDTKKAYIFADGDWREL